MALVWQCDRCGCVSLVGNVDDLPKSWDRFTVPVRGSTGSRSTREAVMCEQCSDLLYDWLHTPARPEEDPEHG